MKIFQPHRLVLLLSLLAVIPLAGCGSDDSGGTGPGGQRNAPNSITVLADSSLKSAFTKLGHQFESENGGATVTFTYGSSAELAQQAVAGDPGDVLATADQQSMVSAQKAQLGSPQVFATKGSNQCQIVTLTQSKNTALSNQFIDLVLSPDGLQALRQAGFSGP